jgi:hypothetical protein
MTQNNQYVQVRRGDLEAYLDIASNNVDVHTWTNLESYETNLRQTLASPVQGWQPIETLPEQKMCMAYTIDSTIVYGYKRKSYKGDHDYRYCDENMMYFYTLGWAPRRLDELTHWQIPQPPQGDL